VSRPPYLRVRVDLKKHLDAVGVTPYQLGKWMSGVSTPTIYAVCSGTRRPSLDVIETILNTLNRHGYVTTLADLIRVEAVEEEVDA
jgi:predicted transcriptional regulator